MFEENVTEFLKLLNWNVSVVVTTLSYLASEELQVELLFCCVFTNCAT